MTYTLLWGFRHSQGISVTRYTHTGSVGPFANALIMRVMAQQTALPDITAQLRSFPATETPQQTAERQGRPVEEVLDAPLLKVLQHSGSRSSIITPLQILDQPLPLGQPEQLKQRTWGDLMAQVLPGLYFYTGQTRLNVMANFSEELQWSTRNHYAFIINLPEQTFEMYTGCNHDPHGPGRYAGLFDGHRGSGPVHLGMRLAMQVPFSVLHTHHTQVVQHINLTADTYQHMLEARKRGEQLTGELSYRWGLG